jgi:hypothetical protein
MLMTQQSINSTTPSPPLLPPISISPGSPPTINEDESNQHPQQQQLQLQINNDNNNEAERETLLTTIATTTHTLSHPATINEELEDGTKNKSSLSLPFENTPPTSPLSLTVTSGATTTTTTLSNGNGSHLNHAVIPKPSLCERSQSDRRKLSVSNIMSFGEQRRRSTSSIFSDMRKMSITNFDSLKSPGIGESFKSSIFLFFHHKLII